MATSTDKKIRVVVAKPGLDGHDRGAKIIARALRDAGMEVIYTGLHQTPEQIVETVIQEDADAVGLSILSGAHMTLVPRIVDLLRDSGASDIALVVGGVIPDEDVPELTRLGVGEVLLQETGRRVDPAALRLADLLGPAAAGVDAGLVRVHDVGDFRAGIASGSFLTAGMVSHPGRVRRTSTDIFDPRTSSRASGERARAASRLTSGHSSGTSLVTE